jgi:ketosteroid isomerase-like protein
MTAGENKRALEAAFAELATGNGKLFVELMADDFRWTVTGTTPWSRTYDGKATVMRRLMRPLFAQFAGLYTNTARRFIAEDEHVVVECSGQTVTKSGEAYDNRYCYVIRFAGGKMRELTEYLDTELVARVLQPPPEEP